MKRSLRMSLQLLILYVLLGCVYSQCPQGWRPWDGKCYYFSVDTKTWGEAHTFCLGQGEGSDLMSINDYHERQWVRTQIGTLIYWIGLNDVAAEGIWEWSDGSTFNVYLASWAPGQPDNWGDPPGEDCGQVQGDLGHWNDEHCNIKRQYICKIRNPNLPTQCDNANGWRQYGSNCYKLKSETTKSWSAARYDCVREGGDLVSIITTEEEQYVVSRLDNSYYDLWLGYSTLKCNKISCEVEAGSTAFTWSDASTPQPPDSDPFLNWGTGEPSPVDPNGGACAALIKDTSDEFGKWRSHLCRQERPYMCKRGLNTVCPAGWESFSGSCYWMVSNPDLLTNFHESHRACIQLGANLLIIHSLEEQYFINGYLPDFHQVDVPDIWIGISDQDQDGVFKWVDKSTIEVSNWGSGWPQNTPNQWDCGQIFTGNYAGKWETTSCFKSHGYICEMTGGQNVKPTSTPGSHCDPGYLLNGESCYHFETESVVNWNTASTFCINQGGNLASFHSPEELSFLTAHMPGEAWVGLSDTATEGTWIYTDGTPADYLPWATDQPDNWQGDEDCANLRGFNHVEAGSLNDDFCTVTKEFICKKVAGTGPPPQPPTSGPDWSETCGSWTEGHLTDYCYLFNYLSMRKWSEARADCVNQGGELASIGHPLEQSFVYSMAKLAPTGISLWLGGHDSVTEGGWEWNDGSPFKYIHWNGGNPDDYYGEDCLTMLIGSGKWNDDNCNSKRGYVCKRRANTPEPPPPHDGYMTALVCQDSTAVLHCPEESVINIQSAFYGRRSDDICPHLDGSGAGSCDVPGILPIYRKRCDNRDFCFAYAHADPDPCPTVSKYLEMTYSCEQKVCLQGLGVEDGNITNSQLSASSFASSFAPSMARLNGNSCWKPAGSPTSSWIQVNFGETRKVTAIVVQGCPTADHWVTKFSVKHSVDGNTWTDYTADGPSFPGATDRNTVETQLLGTPVSAQYIRILPLEYQEVAGLRFDILGCTPDYAITCANYPNFNFANDRMTVHCPAGCARDPYNVFGSTVYRGDSNICAAAIHAGVLLNDVGGDCTLLKKEGQDFYAGSTRNGITSAQFDGSYSVSYTFADGELRCSGADWYEFGDFCYKPFDAQKTWHDAQRACSNLEANLVSILSMKEQMWLESYLYLATSHVWTGLNDHQFSGLFSWNDGHHVTMTYWAPGEPNNHDGFSEDCVEMLYTNGRWNDVSCTKLNTYICKMPKAHYPLPSVQPTVYGCPEGWDAYGYACYWMETNAMTWSDAKTFCKEKKDGFLLHIGDIYEQSHFTVDLSGETGMWWIGLYARGQDGAVDYIWDNGASLTFSHWDRDQPDTGEGTCVAMTSGVIGGFWDDKACTEKYKFFCEKPRPDITPPTKPPTNPPVAGCATSWTGLPHFRNCYRLFHEVAYSQKKSWDAARADCQSRGADLVSIHGQEEENFLTLYSKGTSKWIGLQLNLDGGYGWSDGTPLSHTNWGHGEPNDHDGREGCVEMVSSVNGTHSYWNDLTCDAHQDWICMIAKGKTPVLPPVPPPPVPAPDCGTNPGWRKNNNMCYYYNDTDIVDIYTAVERCYAEKALLVSILSRDEQAYVNTMVGTGEVSAAWIGMVLFGITDGQAMWMDQSPVIYTHWGAGEPNNALGEEFCVSMNRHQGGWNDMNCGMPAGYVCKKFPGDIHTPPPPTQPWEGNCPTGWLRFNNKCFLFRGQKDDIKANWSYARSLCKAQEGDLAVIDNQYENDFVTSYLRDLQLPAWIGLSDVLVENQYGWCDGISPVLYTNWDSNEPNNAGGTEDCVTMTHGHHHLVSGRWNDAACTAERSFVCSRKKSSSINPPPPTKTPCSGEYISWYNNCYLLVTEPATWEAAQAACQQRGGNLASVDMSYEQAFVSGVVLQGKADAWIGLRRAADSNSYTWTDGWPVFYTHWGPGEPTSNTGEGCVSMHGGLIVHGTWNDTKCDDPKPYICKISYDKPPPTPAPGDGKCLHRWTPYGRHCYLVVNEKSGSSWPDARHQCEQHRGELVSIHSRAEMEFLRTMNHSKYHNVWIGLTRDSNFGWAWTDSTSLAYLNWAPGEPNMAFHPGEIAVENCVEMYPDGRWNDNNCLQKRGYACRHRQYYTTDEGGGIVIPTDPAPFNNSGVIAGATIGAIIGVTLILGLLYYLHTVKGIKLSGISLPSRTPNKVDVPAFNNPNFGGESDT